LGSGMNSNVLALAVSGNDLYAGGNFTTAGGSAANYVAKWNGSSWSPLGSGIEDAPNGASPFVYALAVSGSDVYAGGFFSTAGGGAANRIAKWDGSSWSALDSGVGGVQYPVVYALAVSGSDVYAGGAFTTAGGVPANYIAKWNGSSWSALGSGFTGPVFALAVSGSDVYAGGNIGTTDGSGVAKIAKWNGSSWSGLGSGMDQQVNALAVSGCDVYAGGWFRQAGSNAANYIAKWDGSSWSALGSGLGGGVDPRVYALAVSGGDLYAGGPFTTAGGKVSAYIARAYLGLPTLSILRSGGEVTLCWPSSFGGFVLQQNTDVANTNSWSNANCPLTTNGVIKSATVPITPTNQFFRLIGN